MIYRYKEPLITMMRGAVRNTVFGALMKQHKNPWVKRSTRGGCFNISLQPVLGSMGPSGRQYAVCFVPSSKLATLPREKGQCQMPRTGEPSCHGHELGVMVGQTRDKHVV